MKRNYLVFSSFAEETLEELKLKRQQAEDILKMRIAAVNNKTLDIIAHKAAILALNQAENNIRILNERIYDIETRESAKSSHNPEVVIQYEKTERQLLLEKYEEMHKPSIPPIAPTAKPEIKDSKAESIPWIPISLGAGALVIVGILVFVD